jgi:phage baseplate assembly protein V
MTRTRDAALPIGELIRFGRVAEVDGGRVVIETGDVRTDQIRWVERRAGETRTYSPHSVGEQVLLLCPDGDIEGAVAIGGIACDDFPLPGDGKRELVQFSDGAVLAYDPESHTLDAALPEGATALIVASGGVTLRVQDGGLTIEGDVEINGDLRLTGTATADVDVVGGGKSLKDHKHTGVTAGAGVSGPPQ